MKFLILTALFFVILPFSAVAQQRSNSVCAEPASQNEDDVVLTICTHERGMAPRPQPRLYLRVFADGRALYETDARDRNRETAPLAQHKFRVTADELSAVMLAGRSSDFQKAEAKYPAYRLGFDSSRETAIAFRADGLVKNIVVKNFYGEDRESKLHYPGPLIALLESAELIRERAMGVVRPIPAINFCQLLKDREWYIGKKVRIYADINSDESLLANLKYVDFGEFLSEHEEDCEAAPYLQVIKTLPVGYEGDTATRDALKKKAVTIRGPRFDGRARVSVVGTLRQIFVASMEETYRFDISEFKSIEPIVLPYEGRIELGWTYSDTFEQTAANPSILSQPLKVPAHHTARIEWVNEAKFPRLRRPGARHIIFRAASSSMQKVSPNRWSTVYLCEILELR